ncbi:MAG: LLM class flavin-dependent oxidoreductase [Candidatus Nezhaarchaeota archaeon]|nr:LLM class flavin-dependent oxidoreductase [Candidatus Nezhaarchaeota archaeon]MCX8141778.1 LLM class flavin-dependent oxidoreductase [Candidatus Nezhaarchaeota archaeon]MDW8050444.1 LLM class flavin-dependent oxidoreductase [Nitrososphaerota archaeon]
MGEGEVRFGCFLPIPTAPVDRLLKIAQVNEEAGFDSLWFPDHVLFIPPGIVPEAWSMLAATAVLTKRALLGTCVSDPHRYNPAILAQKVATVDQLSGGRVVLGLGAGEAMNLDPFGIDWKKPVSKLREFTTILRKLWAGEIVSFEGEFWRFKRALLHITPVRGKVPIYLGANSPRTLELTGELADGWLSIPLPPRLFKQRLEFVKKGAEKAGRSLNEIDIGIYLYTAIADRAEEAYRQIDALKVQIIPEPATLIEAGYNVELPEDLRSLSYIKALPEPEWLEKFLAYSNFIPREAAIEFSVAGAVNDCIEKLNEYVKAGARHIILVNVGPDPKYTLKVYSEKIIPYFKGR